MQPNNGLSNISSVLNPMLSILQDHSSRLEKIESDSEKIVQAVDSSTNKPHNKDMTDVTIELLDAKLQAAEARTEARVARLETLVETNVKSMEDFKKEISADSKETRKYLSNLKLQAALFSIAMAATVIFGIGAFNSTLLSNMMGSFGMGQSSKDAISTEVAAQNKELNEKLDKLLEAAAKSSAPRL